MTLDLDIDAIEKRARAATPGPWRTPHLSYGSVGWTDPALHTHRREVCRIVGNGRTGFTDDAQFIAAARTDVTELVAHIRQLETCDQWAELNKAEQKNARLRGVLEWIEHVFCDGSTPCAVSNCVSCVARAALTPDKKGE